MELREHSRCANVVYASVEDGGMYGWDVRRSLLIPNIKLKSDPWQFMALSYCGNMLAARSQEKIRLFDLRSYQKHVSEWMCDVRWPCDVTFSPDDQHLLFGSDQGIHTACAKATEEFSISDSSTLKRKSHKLKKKLVQLESCVVAKFSNGPVRAIKWHPRIYQVFAGMHDGSVNGICDISKNNRSQRGILLSTNTTTQSKKSKMPKKDFYSNEFIINPLALPIFRQEKVRNLSLLRVRQRNAAARSRRPELPISGAGENGRIGQHGSTLSSYIIKNIALQQVPSTKEDPRAELLKYSEEAEKNPYWVAPAYAKTQPNPIFRKEPPKEEN